MQSTEYLDNILRSFNIKAKCQSVKQTDNYLLFDLKLQPHAKVKEIQRFDNELALALKMPSKPRIQVIHEQGIVRLEFAKVCQKPVQLFDLFSNRSLPSGDLICLLGQTVNGEKIWMDLAANPHMIVAGTTGSGKSTLLHTIIANLINYNDCHIHLIDPKNIEFHEYEHHFPRLDVHYTYDETIELLDQLLETMEIRYQYLRSGGSIISLPYIVVVIDEFADLSMQDKDEQFYSKLCRLAQKCRAARISLVLSTQRPSVNIINGTIKANFPARIACRVASHTDSRVIIDANGAENLLGKGDALLRDNTRSLERFQVAYTNAKEIVKYFGTN